MGSRPCRRRTLPGPAAALALGLAAGALAGTPARAQEPRGAPGGGAGPARPLVARAVRAPRAPVVDGRLDEEVWGLGEPITGFVQREPVEGRPASERTEVRILYDREALYFGVRLLDRDPEGIVVGEAVRDADLRNSDSFRIVLDTYLDRQNGFVFATTPAGIEYDGQVSKEGAGGGIRRRGQRQQAGSMGGFNLNWDGSWEVATSRDGRGWYAEFRIPFSTLRYGGGGAQRWGVNFSRTIRRRNEEDVWAPIPRQFNLYRLSRAGILEGLEVPARRTATVTPYVLASARRDFRGEAAFSYPTEWGGDAKVGLTPGLTLDLTYNTDFAQVEVDEARVNLTRFNLFFPEKRPFFLENAGVFSVGTPQAVELFFSRRIGIGPGGEPIPIRGGGRLTGKVAGVTVGLLRLRTEGAEGVRPANDYTVARVSRELPNRSRIGGIFVERAAAGDRSDRNRAYAVDGRLGIGEAVTVDAYAARTETPGLPGRERALGVRARYETREWDGSVRYLEVGDAFNPEVGFLDRRGYRFWEFRILRRVRLPDVPWLRELRPHVTYRGYFGFDGFQQSGLVHLDSHVEFADGALFSPAVNWTREGLSEPFEIAPGVVVPPGTYDNWEAAWRFNTNESAPLSLSGTLDFGGFLSGRRRGGSATVTWRSGAALMASVRLRYDDVRLAEGSFDTALLGLRLGYFFTPRVFLQSLVQYNEQGELWSANVRFGWLTTAGTGLFVVYNEARSTGSAARPLNRAFVLKFTRQFRLLGS